MENQSRNNQEQPDLAQSFSAGQMFLSCMASCWICFGIIFLLPGIFLVIYVNDENDEQEFGIQKSGDLETREFGIIWILMSLLPITIGCIIFYCVKTECCQKPAFPKKHINGVHLPQQPNISVHVYQQPDNQVSYNFT